MTSESGERRPIRIDPTSTTIEVHEPEHKKRIEELLGEKYTFIRSLSDVRNRNRTHLVMQRVQLDDGVWSDMKERIFKEVVLEKNVSSKHRDMQQKKVEAEVAVLKDIHRHPFFFPLLDVIKNKEEKIVGYIFDMVDGTNAFTVLEERELHSPPFFSERELLQIAYSISRALGVLHAHGIIHADVKPDNIILPKDEHDIPRLIDFDMVADVSSGLYRYDDQTQSGIRGGTLAFMSPEQVRSNKITTETDLYNLAATLYTLRTGRAVFDEEFGLPDNVYTEAVMLAHAQKLPISIEDRIGTTDVIDEIVMELLERGKKPTEDGLFDKTRDVHTGDDLAAIIYDIVRNKYPDMLSELPFSLLPPKT